MIDKISKNNKAKGGIARALSLTKDERIEIAKKAAETRWNPDILKATHSGNLIIGKMNFPCSVLSDGTRILTQSNFMIGMGMYYSGWIAKNKSKEQSAADIPHFLAFKSITPFINKHLGDLQFITVKYRTEKGSLAHGIKAEIIPKICEIWLDADENIKLGKRQKKIAQNAKVLMRALAYIGIVALVDEVTGYQEIRDKEALQKILDKYLTDEWASWSKTFPETFYKELFRLKDIKYPIGNGKNRPSYVGHWTNEIVYKRLAPGILSELREKNPSSSNGIRPKRHHQYLSRDYGHPKLKEHLSNIIFLMKTCSNFEEFKIRLDLAVPKYGNSLSLKLEN